MKSKQKLLLLKDVEDVGRSGEVVSVKPGFARNFLLPKKYAIYADPNTLKMQDRLKKERAIIAAEHRKEALELAKLIEPMTLSITVKADVDGRMFGSVSAQDIIALFEDHKIKLTKKNILLRKPIKEVGVFEIPIKLQEDVETKITLKIEAEKTKKTLEEKETLKKEEMPKEEKQVKKTKKEKEEEE
jgi:large subunit ribosomal protein L9